MKKKKKQSHYSHSSLLGPDHQWVLPLLSKLLKKSMGRLPFYTKNMLVSVARSMNVCQPRETFPQRSSPRNSGSQHGNWISENLSCPRSISRRFSDLALSVRHWRSIIWFTSSFSNTCLVALDKSAPPFIIALVFFQCREWVCLCRNGLFFVRDTSRKHATRFSTSPCADSSPRILFI